MRTSIITLILVAMLGTASYASVNGAALQTAEGNAVSASNPLPVTIVGGVAVGGGWTTDSATKTTTTYNVGIGSATPQSKLDVVGGDFRVDGTVYASGINTSGSNERWQSKTDANIYVDLNDVSNFARISQLAVDRNLYANGNIGIGTVSPSVPLEIRTYDAGTGTTQGQITNTSAAGDAKFALFNSDGAGAGLQVSGSSYPNIPSQAVFTTTGNLTNLTFMTNGDVNNTGTAYITFNTGGYLATQERMRITSGGNVGIGTVTPQGKLDVNGTIFNNTITVSEALCFTTGHQLGHCSAGTLTSCTCTAN